MPGIVGLITKMPREWAEPQLARMVETLRHESFYATGTWMDAPLGIYAGWIARQGSLSDGMPLIDECGDRVLLFSGEEFPEPGTAARLKARGHAAGNGGPSYLIHLAEEDSTFPACLNGPFQGLLINRAGGSATLFNDRYGLQRLYYHQTKEAFYFAAEAKAILAVRPELRRLDPRGLGEYISCGCVMEDRTLFEGIYALPPASAWVFRNGSLDAKRSYFEPREWEEQQRLGPEAWYQEMLGAFKRNLPRYFNGRERVAMSLTGGLDSRMILAWHNPVPGSLPFYTFGSSYRDNTDVVGARRVAKACGQPHRVITVGKEFLSRFPYFAERAVYLTDGCVEVDRASTLYCNGHAREIAPVRMTGNYGTEVLRPSRAFKPVKPMPGLFDSTLLAQIEAAGQTYRSVTQTHPVAFSAFRQAPWHHQGGFRLEQSQVSMRSPYLDNDLVRTVFRAPLLALSSPAACLRLIAEGNPALRSIPTDRGLGGNRGRLSGAIAHRYLEFTFKAEYAYDYGMPQWVARVDHACAPLHLERLFLGRHKLSHYRVWYRDDLASYVRQMLLDPRSLARPYLQRPTVEALVRGHLKEGRNYTVEIHKLLTLELIHRLFIDANRTAPTPWEASLD